MIRRAIRIIGAVVEIVLVACGRRDRRRTGELFPCGGLYWVRGLPPRSDVFVEGSGGLQTHLMIRLV